MPSGKVIVTVLPASAVPVIRVSSLVTLLIVGAVAVSLPATVVVPGPDTLPASSADTASILLPFLKSTFDGISIV
ncbi:hypothetical protein M6C025_2553 [Staphylococcus aureus]|nr:hypothetical protein M6C025_2553 [Staphylococcus aureus]CAC6839646.1 Uncharacterised protein [Staphylococcus aureus]